MLCGIFGILPSPYFLEVAFDVHEATPFDEGGYGSVAKVVIKGRQYAVKTLHITQGSLQRMRKLLFREVFAWKQLQHENILPFVGVTPNLEIVSDFMENGNIMRFIEDKPYHNRLHLLMGAACGLEYLHTCNVVHGNLKGVNVLIDSKYSARLGDFGLTMKIGESTDGSIAGSCHPKGTTRWMSPEMLYPENFGFPGDVQKQLPSKSTDTYAFGMTILEVLTGQPPYNHIANTVRVILEVTSGRKPDRPPGFSDGLWNLLSRTWNPEYGFQIPKRPAIRTIINQLEKDADGWDQSVILLQQSRLEGQQATDTPSAW